MFVVVGCVAYFFVMGYVIIKVFEKFMDVVFCEGDCRMGLDVFMYGVKVYSEDLSGFKKGGVVNV